MRVRPSRRFAGAQIAWRSAAWAIPIIVRPDGLLHRRRAGGRSRGGQSAGRSPSRTSARSSGVGAVGWLTTWSRRLPARCRYLPSRHPRIDAPRGSRRLPRGAFSASNSRRPRRPRHGFGYDRATASACSSPDRVFPASSFRLEWGRVETSRARLRLFGPDAVAGIVSAATPWTFVGRLRATGAGRRGELRKDRPECDEPAPSTSRRYGPRELQRGVPSPVCSGSRVRPR